MAIRFAVHDESGNYYEDLGIAPDASPQEIRDAFHLHVRLLHPDQQTDPLLRELAEKQMRKLNRIYAVLSDPGSRDAYDLTLHGIPAPAIVTPVPQSEFRRVAARTPWAAAILLSTGALVWLAYDVTPSQQTRNFEPGTVQASSSQAATRAEAARRAGRPESAQAEIARLQAELKAAETQRNQALREVARLRGKTENGAEEAWVSPNIRPADLLPPAPPPIVTEPVAPPKLPSASPMTAAAAAHLAHAPNRKLAGFWFYAVPPDGQQNKNQALYVPEYIEATVTEDNGSIHGRYRSRFVIPDRAIPPDVNFTFAGTLNGTQCTCQWTGGGGARGQVTLKLTGDNSMKIDWAASELGSLGLASGTATLTRRIEPAN